MQDSRGYVWIATYGGLTRYNGHSLTSFVNTIDNKLFGSNRIRSLYEDINRDLWIGTDAGVTIYNRTTGGFYNLEHSNDTDQGAECIVRKIFPSQDGSLIYCLTERQGVLVYDKNKVLKLHLSLDQTVLFQDALYISNESYLLASNRGLLLYDFENGKFEELFVSASYGINSFATLCRVNENTILYGSNEGIRVVEFNVEDEEIEIVISKDSHYAHRSIKYLMMDDENTLWVGTMRDGLHCLEDAIDNLGKPLTRLSKGRRISVIIDSSSGTKWVGSFDDGLYCYNSTNSIFKTLDTEEITDATMWTISATAYSNDKILYQHGYNSLSLFDLNDGKIKKLPFDLNEQDRNAFRYIIKRSNGDIWLFMQDENRCWRVIVKSGSNRIIRIDEPLLKDFEFRTPYSLVEDCWGDLWIGTAQNLYRLSVSDNQIENVESIIANPNFVDNGLSKIRAIYPDPYANALWIAGETRGLIRFDIGSRTPMEHIKVKQYKEGGKGSITSNFVTSIVRTPDNTLYIGTEQGGMCRVNENSDDLIFESYGTESGLASNNVKSIICDNNGNLWVSTSYGLSQYDPVANKFINYYKEQGLPFDKFLYFGGYIGDRVIVSNNRNLCYFNPSELKNDAPIPNVEFTNFKLFNEIVKPQESYNGRVILNRVPQSGDIIELKPNEICFL